MKKVYAQKSHRTCVDLPGVQLPPTKDWACAGVGGECTHTHCCNGAGVQCYEKDKYWAICNTTCTQNPEKGGIWSCKVLSPPPATNPVACRERCLGLAACKQAVFSPGDLPPHGCYLFGDRAHDVTTFQEIYNYLLWRCEGRDGHDGHAAQSLCAEAVCA